MAWEGQDIKNKKAAINREAELKQAGWEKRHSACEPRLSESVELYQSMGFEVLLEVLPAVNDEGSCQVCLQADRDQYRVIYTRKTDRLRGD